MKLGYRWCLHDAAYDSLATLRRSQQRKVVAAIREIAAYPFRPSAYRGTDSEGFEIAVVYVADCMISYHADHAVRMVEVREITTLP